MAHAPQVICRYGSFLCVCNAHGTRLQCAVYDVMSPTLASKQLFDVPLQTGHPLSMCADIMADRRAFMRIICGRGIVVCHPGGVSNIAGEYSASRPRRAGTENVPICQPFRRMRSVLHRRRHCNAARIACHPGGRRTFSERRTPRHTLACQAWGYRYMCESSVFSFGLLL